MYLLYILLKLWIILFLASLFIVIDWLLVIESSWLVELRFLYCCQCFILVYDVLHFCIFILTLINFYNFLIFNVFVCFWRILACIHLLLTFILFFNLGWLQRYWFFWYSLNQFLLNVYLIMQILKCFSQVDIFLFSTVVPCKSATFRFSID